MKILAFDFGASSGRAMAATLEGGKIKMEEIHRFSNDPVQVGDTFYWDVFRLYHEIKQGIMKAGKVDAIGIDTWGVDFGLLDENGMLMGNPRHYRDEANAEIGGGIFERISEQEVYGISGVPYLAFNTLNQLYVLQQKQPWLLKNAKTLLMMPDLFGYFLTGVKNADYSNASTTSMLNVETKKWDEKLLAALGIDPAILPELHYAGRVLGNITPKLAEELMVDPETKVITVGSHDTASAVLAVPAKAGEETAFISCGTWSLLGCELDAPINDEQARLARLSNEGGAYGNVRFLRNIMGLWLIQETKRYFKKQGKDYSFEDLKNMALESTIDSIIDVDDPRLSPPGNMPGRVRTICEETGQSVPATDGDVMRVIYYSLAQKYKEAVAHLSAVTGKKFDVLRMVGGGIQDTLLCQLSANATGLPVYAGPVEATVLGNIAAQLIALGAVKDVEEARKLIADSFPVKTYLPEEA
ncbi:MAG: rhamnulokinase [Clostridia bacterium]|nr:rhamnulokinase [Clostridia bacterium]